MENAEIVVSVIPYTSAGNLQKMLGRLRPQMIFVNSTKGIEIETQMRMEEVIRDVLHDCFEPRYVALSAPALLKRSRAMSPAP
ncbi:MAG: hypothetical protein IPG76_01780 [Acidobacteria bacterium]|nr:hypothetical protein [Acidobacteriota bacterium]